MPNCDAHTSPMNGSSSHGATARVALPMHSIATTTIPGPISLASASSSCSGRGSMERHKKMKKHSTLHSASTPSTRQRDQRHSKPSAGITGHRYINASTAARFGENGSSVIDTASHKLPLLIAIRHDRPISNSVSRNAARRLSASATGTGASGDSTAGKAATVRTPVGAGARINRCMATR